MTIKVEQSGSLAAKSNYDREVANIYALFKTDPTAAKARLNALSSAELERFSRQKPPAGTSRDVAEKAKGHAKHILQERFERAREAADDYYGRDPAANRWVPPAVRLMLEKIAQFPDHYIFDSDEWALIDKVLHDPTFIEHTPSSKAKI